MAQDYDDMVGSTTRTVDITPSNIMSNFKGELQLQNHCDCTVSCNRVDSVFLSHSSPISLVSALCYFHERVG